MNYSKAIFELVNKKLELFKKDLEEFDNGNETKENPLHETYNEISSLLAIVNNTLFEDLTDRNIINIPKGKY